ncbi:hypothetical protein KIW84_058327 [Lathyrus oleraceus]|uniref:Retrotransposon protein, putative, Ty1-copia subclass n=1 Tax=Pisum sativum TaxID=3888 RepID=A0A9D4X5Y0_PEA|nr:hypothetical protein KIW84_058327 [Pisum sativum]
MYKIPYAYTIGFIMYAMLCTRPDVSYSLSATSRYQSDPGDAHWVAVKYILKYLRRNKDSFLIYGGQEELAIIGYTDASFQTDKDDFRSQYGYVFCLNGGVVSWKSSKQDTVVDSTIKAEYIATPSAAKEVVWIKKFISELGITPSIVDPIGLYCDNNDRGDVKICRVPTLDNIANPLTKPLAQQKHDVHTRSMGSRSRESHCRSESSGFWSYAYGTRQYAYEMAGTRMALGNTRMDEEDDVLNVFWSLLVRVWECDTRSIRVWA